MRPPLFGQEIGIALFLARVDRAAIEVEHLEVLGPPGAHDHGMAANAAGPPEALDLIYRSGALAGPLSELIFDRVPGAAERFAASTGGIITDALGVTGSLGPGRSAVLLAARIDRATMTAPARRRWRQAMAHVCAGLRLRRSLKAGADRTEAVLDAEGRVHDATGDARPGSAREALRDAVQRIERARSARGRSDPDAALASWQGLVDGRWSLVDRFESDGRRFVVALENEPEVPDPRGLSRRECQVAERVGLGLATKEIAYELGVSLSAVSMAAATAWRKLGLGSRTELAAFFAPGGLRTRLVEASVQGERLLVGSHPAVDERQLERLTPAEREVADALLAGSTSAHVAEQRGTSERTVANQIASIFDKLGVASRVELAARLHAEPAAREATP